MNKKILIKYWIERRESQSYIANLLKATTSEVEYYIKKYKLTRKRTKSKFILNEDKINIDNPEFCYLYGLLSSDGYLDVKNNRICFIMKNKTIPKIYNNIINYLQYNGNYTKVKDTYILRITNVKLVRYFLGLGITANKSFDLTFPKFIEKDDCMRMYIRGLLDGDGNIRKFNKFRITTGSLNLIEGLALFINNKFNLNYLPSYQKGNGKLYPKLEIASIKNGGKILTWIYYGYSKFRLEEKYKNIILDNDIVQSLRMKNLMCK